MNFRVKSLTMNGTNSAIVSYRIEIYLNKSYFLFLDFSIVVCLLLMLSETIYGQRDKWSWSSNNNNHNNRNNIDDRRDRDFDRRKYESLEDFR